MWQGEGRGYITHWEKVGSATPPCTCLLMWQGEGRGYITHWEKVRSVHMCAGKIGSIIHHSA